MLYWVISFGQPNCRVLCKIQRSNFFILMSMKCKEGLCCVSVHICFIYWKKFCFKFLFSFGVFFLGGCLDYLLLTQINSFNCLKLYILHSAFIIKKNARTNELHVRISLMTRGMTLKWLTIRYTLIIHSKDQKIKLWNDIC